MPSRTAASTAREAAAEPVTPPHPRAARVAADVTDGERVRRYGDVSSALALHSDRQLADLIGSAEEYRRGIGGVSVLLDVVGVPVFAKRVPLTDLERHPDHVMSTANLFDMPLFCQYGLAEFGTPGFGAWRELAASTLATNWVLTGRSAEFPLLYHWRVLPSAANVIEEHADVEKVVAYWQGSSGVRDRLHAMRDVSASIVLFLEFVPHNLDDWLAIQDAAGAEAVAAACTMVESGLFALAEVMAADGLVHFDTHFGNILTDGRRLHLTDFGLATSTRFDLSAPEATFLADNRSHDLAYMLTRLVNWLVTTECVGALPRNTPAGRRNAYVRRCATGAVPASVLPEIADVIRRHAPIAAILNDFYWDFYGTSRLTPYPAAEAERALRSYGIVDRYAVGSGWGTRSG